jgi:signal transduction histidine kinase
MVINLLSNAIKFSPENSRIEIMSEQKKGGYLSLSVKDKGIGISREDQEHLFERFFRGANVSNIQGTGLGLHIVTKYAELMNGAVTCKSELGKGTEFVLEFNESKEMNAVL